MFILTIDSNDPDEIANILKTLADDGIESDAVGITDGSLTDRGIAYEYDTLPQSWVAMADFLHFAEDGNTLIPQ